MSRRPPLIDGQHRQRSCWVAAFIDCAFLAAAAAIGLLLGAGEIIIEGIKP
jgi:hypothetical protein